RRRRRLFESIRDQYAADLVTSGGARQDRPRGVICAESVAEQDQARSRAQYATRTFQRGTEMLALLRCRMIPVAQAPQHLQHAAAATSWLDFVMDAAAETQGANAVAGLRGHPRKQACRARCLHTLEADSCSEAHAGIEIQHAQQTMFALFLEQLGMRSPAARCHPPVHVADVVARLVHARFAKIDTASAPAGDVQAGACRGTAPDLDR